MRGQRVFQDINQRPGLVKLPRRGRSNTLMARRNDCLIARCYYWSTEKHKCYEEVIRLLVDEFFLSPATISRLLQQGAEQLVHLKLRPPTQYYLQLRWPHFRW